QAQPAPALARALALWPGSYYWSDEADGRHLVLTRPLTRRRETWALHLTLFLATLATTTLAGAVFSGVIPYDPNPFDLFTGASPFPPHAARAWAAGLEFSLPLVPILLVHDRGRGRGRRPPGGPGAAQSHLRSRARERGARERLRRLARDGRHNAEPPAARPALRRPHAGRGAAALAPARGAGVLGAGDLGGAL